MDFHEFDNHVKSLSQNILNSFSVEAIVGIARGGWIPARLFSKYLGVKKIYSFGMTYTDKNRTELLFYQTPEISEKNVLIVEDFLETGRSIIAARKQLIELQNKNVKTACIYYTNKTLMLPDFSLGMTEQIPKLPWD